MGRRGRHASLSDGRTRADVAPGPLRFLVPSILLALALLLAAGAPARAQERSDTGRRQVVKPPKPGKAESPVVERTQAAVPAPDLAADPDRWVAGIAVGMGDAGDLFRVETTTPGAVAAWGPAGDTRFRASRFTATVDPGLAIGVHAARRLGRGRWWLRAEAARGSGDIAAESLLGQGGEVFFYDRATFLTFGLGLEGRLTSWPSHPYAGLGLTACRVSADRYDELSDTGFGARAALGYRHRLGRSLLGLEIGLARIGMDFNDFRPPIAEAPEPEFRYEPVDAIWRVDVRILASRRW